MVSVADDRDLSPEQDRALDRLQVVGFVALTAIVLGGQIVAATTDIELWKLVSVVLAALVALAAVLTYVVSRIEGTTPRVVLGRSSRTMAAELRTKVARLRRFSAGR